MQTNYKKINSFEAATVGLMAVGVVLLGYILYQVFPDRQQKYFIDAVAILDVHERVPQVIDGVEIIFGTTQDFLDEFYVAFTQVASLPDNTFAIGDDLENIYFAILNYSDYVATDYNSANQDLNHVQIAYGQGVVSGISLDLNLDTESTSVNCGGEEASEVVTEHLEIPYAYKPLDKTFLKETIINHLTWSMAK